ncbi:MAG: alpha/beta hydrolase fold domain-containing protein [Akkermansiaceae bacterium]|nr:alpha/beta hydrolase fold domain-containing protein [Akkermansiaceae bacterium]
MRILLACVVALLSLTAAWGAPKIYRVMPVGDSITEGGSSFSTWRYGLWEKLYTAGYLIEYVGSRKTDSRIGELPHEGYGGKNSGFLAATVPGNFRKHPADIVLLHAGHNHFADQKPVPQILKDTEALIDGFRAVNPKVTILLAQPIHSGKLPKYSYIPELQKELVPLAKRLDRPDSRVIIVPQGEGFVVGKDTVPDLVHPNASGAAKMADKWFEALVKVMEPATPAYRPEIRTYKKHPRGDLTLHVFKPSTPSAKPRPAIVFFFGGGWKQGTPLQFYAECTHFASKGMVAISADYRTAFSHRTTAFEAVSDGKSAIRWVRQHAKELGIDPNQIIAAGASAGGQVAAAAGTLKGLDEPSEDQSISSRPDALALWYPVLDNGPQGYGDAKIKARYMEISPLHNVTSTTPPTILFLGTQDRLVPVATARDFESRMKKAGVACEVQLFVGIR